MAHNMSLIDAYIVHSDVHSTLFKNSTLASRLNSSDVFNTVQDIAPQSVDVTTPMLFYGLKSWMEMANPEPGSTARINTQKLRYTTTVPIQSTKSNAIYNILNQYLRNDWSCRRTKHIQDTPDEVLDK